VCKEVVTSCDADGIVSGKNWCETEKAAVNEGKELSCFWLYSDDEKDTTDAGSCRDVTNTSLSCSMAKRQGQCALAGVTNLAGDRCIWVAEETDAECQSKKSICGDVGTEPTCNHAGVTPDTCLWLYGNSSQNPQVNAGCKKKVWLLKRLDVFFVGWRWRCDGVGRTGWGGGVEVEEKRD
jgi:hypothetical protein